MTFATNFIKLFLEQKAPAKIRSAILLLYITLSIHIFKAGTVSFEILQSASKGTATLLEAALYIGFFSLPPVLLFYLIQKIQNKSIFARNSFALITLTLLAFHGFLYLYPLLTHNLCVLGDLLTNPIIFHITLIPAKGDAAVALISIYNMFHKDSQAWFRQSKAKQMISNHG